MMLNGRDNGPEGANQRPRISNSIPIKMNQRVLIAKLLRPAGGITSPQGEPVMMNIIKKKVPSSVVLNRGDEEYQD